MHRAHDARQHGAVADAGVEHAHRWRPRMNVGELECRPAKPLPISPNRYSRTADISAGCRRNGNCAAGRPLLSPEATGGAGGFTTGRTPGGVGSNSTRRCAGTPSALRAMNVRMRSSVSVVIRPPLRKRLGQFAVIDRAAAEGGFGKPAQATEFGDLLEDLFVHDVSRPALMAVAAQSEPTPSASVNNKSSHWKDGQSGWASSPTSKYIEYMHETGCQGSD